MQHYFMEDHEPSLLPDGDWQLVWNDEFDGTELNRENWDFRMSMMGLPWPAWQTAFSVSPSHRYE